MRWLPLPGQNRTNGELTKKQERKSRAMKKEVMGIATKWERLLRNNGVDLLNVIKGAEKVSGVQTQEKHVPATLAARPPSASPSRCDSRDIVGAIIRRYCGSNYPEIFWEQLCIPKTFFSVCLHS